MSSTQHPPSSNHSLAFRVMRLCRPSFQSEDSILRLDPFDIFAGEDLFDESNGISPSLLDATAAASAGKDLRDFSYRSRYQMRTPSDAISLPGLLMVPQSFGAIYLGETFSSYISVNNSSHSETRDVVIKAEIQTEKQRILLFTTKSHIESIRAGGRYDFIVEHDVKELGVHTLVCTALYNDGESEHKYLPQFFKFVVSNPLSVKTKVRSIKMMGNQRLIQKHLRDTLLSHDKTYLEACIENHTKSNLFMDQVEFEPAQNWSATILNVDDHPSKENSLIREIFKPPILIKASGGIQNYLYRLRQTLPETRRVGVVGSNLLGKLQITWRTNLGEPGRLQTHRILGRPVTQKDVDFQVLKIPSIIVKGIPFLVQLSFRNQTDRKLGPFAVSVSQDYATEDRVVMVNGLQKLVFSQLEAFDSTDFDLNMIATRVGIQKIYGITVSDAQEKKLYDTLADVEIYVASD